MHTASTRNRRKYGTTASQTPIQTAGIQEMPICCFRWMTTCRLHLAQQCLQCLQSSCGISLPPPLGGRCERAAGVLLHTPCHHAHVDWVHYHQHRCCTQACHCTLCNLLAQPLLNLLARVQIYFRMSAWRCEDSRLPDKDAKTVARCCGESGGGQTGLMAKMVHT